MRIIVIGGSGYLGRHIVAEAAEQGMAVHATRRTAGADGFERLDVADVEAVRRMLAALAPDAVVNAAMSPSPFDSTSADNWAVNAIGAVNVARAAAEQRVRLVHVSSDAIFSGRPEPYSEDDRPDPVYAYGAAKAAAELAIATINPDAALARPSLITADGDDLSRRERHILDVVAGRAGGVFFTDEVRCPVGVNDMARACVELARTDYAGVLNATGPEPITLHALAQGVARRHGFDPARVPASDHATAGVRRPGQVVLDTARVRATLTTRLRGISELLSVDNQSLATG